MPRPNKRRPSPVQPVNRVEVHRTYHGESWVVRILAPYDGGLFVHFIGKRGEYCPGPDQCMPGHHKLRRHWRGYCAAERYLQAQNKWQPTVLEITEALEVVFRPRFFRGQVWRVWRAEFTRDSQEPIRGEELEPIPPDQLPPEFDIRPTLLRLYDVEAIELGHPNPKPMPTVMPLSEGPTPATPTRAAPTTAQKPASPELMEQLRKRMASFGSSSPKPESNGKR